MDALRDATEIDREILADLERVCAGAVAHDPVLATRVAEGAERAREETKRLLGVQEVGAGIVREMREAR